MSKNKSDLSITKRLLLDYIQYKTNNNFPFFGGNDYIAKCLSLTQNTAKTMVNELIRAGYLIKGTDKKKRRLLSYSGKEYAPLFEDLRNIDKKVLKMERDDFKRDNDYLNQQLSFESGRLKQLSHQNTELICSNEKLSQRVQALENLFFKNGVSSEQLEKLLQTDIVL